ncbi:MAG: tol-pal system-associated acyl-CoA thioesterase [Hyphomicrobiales bacterium]
MPISEPFHAAHTIEVRVYYEDTDLAGIVYHANYLKFMERARTDYLRDHGIDQSVMAAGAEGAYFAVRSMDIGFIAPARFDDLLRVETMPVSASGARGVMDQRVMRGDEVLCTARVTVACISTNGRPTRFPAKVRQMFQSG